MNERLIRILQAVLMALVLIFALISLGISADLVSKYNKHGRVEFPDHTNGYRDRTRIILTASIWTTLSALVLLIGFQLDGHSAAFGILTHFIPALIGFILFMIGAASLTGLTNKISCGNKDQDFPNCSLTKSLVVVSWIDTIFLFIFIVFLLAIMFKARAWGGVRRNTLYVD